MNEPPPPIREQLRAATAASHRRLENLWQDRNLREFPVYTSFLAANATVFLPLERALERAGVADLLPDWPSRRRVPALCQDLAGTRPKRLGPFADIQLRGSGQVLGTLYVLEGARHGAAVLARQLADTEPAIRDNRRFLLHGQRHAFWPVFLSRLATLHPSEFEPARAQAVDCFDRLESASQKVQSQALA